MSTPAEIIDYALGIEASAESWSDHYHFARRFKAAADSLVDGDARKKFVMWEIWLYDCSLNKPETLQPMVREAFPQEALDYFRDRLETAKHPSVRARLADFLWLHSKEIKFADSAIASYFEAVPALLPSSRGTSMACDYLARVVYGKARARVWRR